MTFLVPRLINICDLGINVSLGPYEIRFNFFQILCFLF